MARRILALSAALAFGGCGEKAEPPVDDLAPTATPVAGAPPPETGRRIGDCRLRGVEDLPVTIRDADVQGVPCPQAARVVRAFGRSEIAPRRGSTRIGRWSCRSGEDLPEGGVRWSCRAGKSQIRFAVAP